MLIEAVANGGSVSFMHPLPLADGRRILGDALAAADRGERIVLGAFDGDDLIGTRDAACWTSRRTSRIAPRSSR